VTTSHQADRGDAATGERASASVVDSAADAIREEIKKGRLAPGQRLIEGELCTVIGASRTSIREALGRLEAEGLVEVEHQKGARVRRLTHTDVKNIYQIREALEGAAARMAAGNVSSSDYRARLVELERQFGAEDDRSPACYLDYNEEFHRLIVEMSQNGRIRKMVEQLHHTAFLTLIQAISTPQAAATAHSEHLPVIDAILQGDGARAEDAMRAHIRRTGRDVLARLGADVSAPDTLLGTELAAP
jgi:DNA-binding GntR family transcriptional regulator